MTLNLYLWGMRLGTILSLAAFGLVVFWIDPEKSGIFSQVIFYLSLFLAFSGILTLFLTWVRRKLTEETDSNFAYVGISFRQGILLSFLAVALLFLQSFKILTWWDGLLVVAGVFLVELYFLSR